MIADTKTLRLSLTAGCGCFVVVGLLYVRALAGAGVFGTYSSFAHPWRSIPADILLFGFSAVLLVILSVFLQSGSRAQRLGAVALAALPAWVFGHFIVWLLRMYES